MKLIWSDFSQRLHRFDGNGSDERCNIDQIREDDRRTAEVAEDRSVREFARQNKLAICKRCLRGVE